MNQDFYTISELGEKLNIPRTTINDYLARYGHYASAVMRGKRRVYSGSTLELIREINRLRTGGATYAAIEEELGRKFPVQPELHTHTDDANTDNKDNERDQIMNDNQNFQMVSTEELRSLAQYINKAEEHRQIDARRAGRRLLWPLLLLLAICTGLAIITVMLGARLLVAIQENSNLARESSSSSTELITTKLASGERAMLEAVREGVQQFSLDQSEQLNALLFKLDAKSQAQQKEISALRDELVEQRKSAAAQFEELRTAMTGRLESETKLLRENHARELAALTAREKALAEQVAGSKAVEDNLREQLDQLTAINDSLKAELEALKNLNATTAAELDRVAAENSELKSELEGAAVTIEPIVEAAPAEEVLPITVDENISPELQPDAI